MASSPDVAGSPPRRSCATASTTPGLRPDRWVGALERRFAPAGDGTPSTATPVVGRHHLNLDAGRDPLAKLRAVVTAQRVGDIVLYEVREDSACSILAVAAISWRIWTHTSGVLA